MCVCACMFVCVCAYVCIHVCVYVCVYVVVYVYVCVLLCDRTSPGEMQNPHMSIPDGDPTTGRSVNITTLQLDEPLEFVGVAYRNMGEGLPMGAEMIQRQLHHQSPPQCG